MPTVNIHTSQLKLFTLTGIAGGWHQAKAHKGKAKMLRDYSSHSILVLIMR